MGRLVAAACVAIVLGLGACGRAPAAVAQSLPCREWVGSSTRPPAGVLRRDRFSMGDPAAPPWVDPAPSWRLPSDVALEVRLSRQSTTELVVEAVLENRAREPRVLYLDTPGFGLNVLLQGPNVRFEPEASRGGLASTPPPHTFPEPVRYLLPAGARWVFESVIDLRCWRYVRGSRASVQYTFSLSRTPRSGALEVRLP